MNGIGYDPLGGYLERVLSPEDRVLFDEAVASARTSAIRAAYIMVWLSCAESLKRKFRELAPRDGNAARITGEIGRREANHQSVDNYILDQAKDYGFIREAEHTQLQHIYVMRCLFGHPYETRPTVEQLVAAASTAIDHVLSRPTRLRHGYITDQVGLITSDAHFLDDLQVAVENYAGEVYPRVDEGLRLYFMRRLWPELERMVHDPAMAIYMRRGIWFSRTFLRQCINELLPSWDVVQDLTRAPDTLSTILSDPTLFTQITGHAQDIVVGTLIQIARASGTGLRLITELHEAGVLSDRHRERFEEAIRELPLSYLVSSGFPPIYYAQKFIDDFKSPNFYTQNPALEALNNLGQQRIASLPDRTLVLLGNNVLQAAQGNAKSAISMLREMASNPTPWPEHFVEGILSECFINEGAQIRFKVIHLDSAIRALLKLGSPAASGVVTRISARIQSGTFKNPWPRLEYRDEAVRTIDETCADDQDAQGILEPLRVALLNLEVEQVEEDKDE
jgi:hypothetical protein